MSYSDLLKSPKWQKVRLKVLERDNWMCQKGKKPWEYPLDNFLTLCEKCHELEEKIKVINMYEHFRAYSIVTKIPMSLMIKLIHALAFSYSFDHDLFIEIRSKLKRLRDEKDNEFDDFFKKLSE